ncbi:PREDICTED: L-gulonolactone oxidase-like [Lepidothrix coronata]|uniref:L-gulonolactone oxidase-like n=1 Tax=Lepidothrix coronata TaxID=321398 RepID=A0A6J0J8T9_9PASS|nr:PREDICTED: L-gulonolactone oxidase-like [Lepidothrix coronata]
MSCRRSRRPEFLELWEFRNVIPQILAPGISGNSGNSGMSCRRSWRLEFLGIPGIQGCHPTDPGTRNFWEFREFRDVVLQILAPGILGILGIVECLPADPDPGTRNFREFRELRNVFPQILALARRRGRRVKVVGGGHSPSDIACTDGFLLHLGAINRVLQVDPEKRQVTVEGGILLSELNRELDKHGLALENLGILPVILGQGFGKGVSRQGMSPGIPGWSRRIPRNSLPRVQVVALTLLLASGEILECSEAANPEVFQAARLHLGCLGIVLSVTFQCVPEFRLREVAFPSTLPQVLEQLEEHLERSQYFRFLWFPHSDHVRIIYQDPTDQPPCSSSSWIWDYAVGYYLLEFLLWISTFIPALVPWINRCFFRLLFSSRVEKVARSHRIFNYECRFRQHVQDWAIPM